MRYDDETTIGYKLTEVFQLAEEQTLAAAELARYGSEDHEREPQRVRLAVLKLCGPSLERLSRYVDHAKTDYRDVLAWAEFPSEMALGADALESERISARAKDREEYQKWLKNGSHGSSRSRRS